MTNCAAAPGDCVAGVVQATYSSHAEDVSAAGCRFIRFPGGCYVEGDTLAHAFRWKTAVGLSGQRRGHWNLWGYWSTDGRGNVIELPECGHQLAYAPALQRRLFQSSSTCLQGLGRQLSGARSAGCSVICLSSSTQSAAGLGLFEYMQLAEELGAEPVWVINNGVAHADSVPATDIQPWVQVGAVAAACNAAALAASGLRLSAVAIQSCQTAV